VTPLESKLYVALLGARTIVSATANVNPAALKILRLMDSAAADYKGAKNRERGPALEHEEEADAAGE
jgi:hypothetical protein